jgi:hypothetical protein
MAPSPPIPLHSRRLTSRAKIPDGLWVCWRCDGREDVSRVRNLSGGGLFITTRNPWPLDVKVKLEFLAQEGQIRAEAIVRHMKPGEGVGLKFTAVPEADCPHLAALITRVRKSARF